jgi:hypothetical protein
MKNPLMSRLLGESDDVVPVIANTSRATFRSRAVQSRQTEDETDDSVQRMVGEAKTETYGGGNEDEDEDEGVIPDNAEPIDSSEMVVGKPLRQPKEIVQEPSHPTGDKEKYQTPYAALTAPDVTPQSTQPIDPSQIPGAAGAEKFTAADLERAGSVEPSSGDVAAKAMDVLLGRNRAAKAATQPGEFEQAGEIATTEEQAAAMLGIQTPLYEKAAAKAASVLVPATEGGSAMPPPIPVSNGAAVYSAFRRFAG